MKSAAQKKSKRSRRKHAPRYAYRGLSVVPMHAVTNGICSCGDAKCNHAGKHPRTAHGVKDATTDAEQIKAWWKRKPRSNIGIAAGKKSGIVVLDVDVRHGGDATLAQCETELGSLPETVTAITGGGGRHLFFKYPDFPVRKDTAGKIFGSGVDVLSDGSIVIVPPSRHASGKRYAWVGGKSIADTEPAVLPAAWLDRLRDGPKKEVSAATEPTRGDPVTEGHRNNYLTSLAGAMQRTGASAESILAALNQENSSKCSPPLDDAEVQSIVASITRYQPTPLSDVTDPAEKVMHLVLDRHFGGGKHLLLGPEGRFWFYDIRLWRPIPDKWVSGKVLQVIQANPMPGQNSASLINQTLTLLKAKLATKDDVLSYTAEPPPVINCANGEVWIADDGSVELRPHRPESYLRDGLDVTYDPAATCPQYDRAVLEIFSKANKPKRMVRHWNELMGYVLQPRRNIPIIVIMLGGGDNGKTVLINTVVRLLGHQLVQAKSVDSLDKSQFAIGSLFGKRLFLDDDVKAGARLPDGMLKTMSEAKIVTGEKKHQDDFNFVVRSVPVLLCNNIPSLADLSKGMIRRLMVIPFDRTFTDEEKDPDLFQRIWTQELSGILNQALAGYKRVVERNFRFKRPSPVTSATNRWLQQANPLPAFIHDRCIKKANGKVLVRDFYAAYTEWTKEMGYTLTQTQIVMTRNLAHRGYGTKRTNSGVAIIGLELREVE
jgi:putative DNA primase/helicase